MYTVANANTKAAWFAEVHIICLHTVVLENINNEIKLISNMPDKNYH